MRRSPENVPGFHLAVAAQVLYLVNLLLLPGLAFLLLLWLWWRYAGAAAPLAASHLAQTVTGSLWAGGLLGLAGLLLLALGDQGATVWVVTILYFVLCHALLVFCGAFGLSKALAGRCWRYPLIGRRLPAGCDKP